MEAPMSDITKILLSTPEGEAQFWHALKKSENEELERYNNELKRLNNMTQVIIPVSIGEVYDKLSILDIKKKKITDEEKLKHVNKEFDALKLIFSTEKFDNSLYEQLVVVNSELWEIEDKIRICEKNKQFNEEFIKLARSVYFKNDKRAEIKLMINQLYGSDIIEVKSYEKYV